MTEKKEKIKKKEVSDGIEKRDSLWAKYARVYKGVHKYEHFMKDEGWEVRYSGDDLAEMKLRFLDQLKGRSDADFLRARWKEGIFDSVDKYIVVHTAYVLNLLPVQAMRTKPFIESGATQPEQGDISEHLHPIDITYDDLEDWSWGPAGRFMAWREKKDGTPGFVTSGLFSSCWITGTVPLHVEVVEFTSKGAFVLYPYVETDIEHEGVTLQAHKWRPPVDYKEQPEGIIILTSAGERRCKNFPSIDIDIRGTVWEVVHDGQLQRRIRPRVRVAQLYRLLSKYVSLRYLDVPKLDYPILYNGKGDVKVPHFEGDTLLVDTNIRSKVVQAYYQGDIIKYVHGKHTIVKHKQSPPPSLYLFSTAQTSRFGVKAFFEEAGKIMLFKDGTKKWDFIGGKVESSDVSTVAALRREIREETGVSYQGRCVYLGLSQEQEWVTALYRIDKIVPKKGRFGEWRPGMDTVSWLPRLVNHVTDEGLPKNTSFLTEMSTTGNGANLLARMIEVEAKQSSRFAILDGAIRLSHVMASHVKFVFYLFFKVRPLHAFIFVEQVRSEYRVAKLEPPDQYQVYRLLHVLRGYVFEGAPRFQITVQDGDDSHLLKELVF